MSSKSTTTGPRFRDKPVSLNLDEILVRADRSLRADPEIRLLAQKASNHLMNEIEQNQAVASLRALCAAHCDRQELLWLLAACSEEPEPERGDELVGLNDRQLRAAVKSFQKCADRIERINQRSVGKLFNAANIAEPFMLPHLLRHVSALLMFVASLRFRFYWTAAKKRLVLYVKERTGSYHDKRLAELIAAPTQRTIYGENAHREWRRRNIHREVRLELPAMLSRHVAEPLTEAVFFMCGSALLKKLRLRE